MGMHPNDLDDLSLQEFFWMWEGFLIRDAKRQEPLRILYFAVSNGFLKKGKSFSKVKSEWPLYTDTTKDKGSDLSEIEMKRRWEQVKNLNDGASRN